MNNTFELIKRLISLRSVLISLHGYDELADDDLMATEILSGAAEGTVIEDYPDFHKGPAVLVLQHNSSGIPVHVVWGIPKGQKEPAVLVTAYKPDPELWSKDLKRRITK